MAAEYPVLALIAVVLLAGAVLLVFWPRPGALGVWRRLRESSQRTLREDALKHIHTCEVEGTPPNVQSVAGTLHIRLDTAAQLLGDMERRSLISYIKGPLHLTEAGREAALHIIRAHRLWESHLAEETGVQESRWHRLAEKQEHRLTVDQADALAAQLGHPTHDPHGDPIPTHDGTLLTHDGQPLNTAQVHAPMQIVHVEDEPPAVYAALVAKQIRPGMNVRVLEKNPQSIRFWADGREQTLTHLQASNIAVAPLSPHQAEELAEEEYLCNLAPGQTARVRGLTRACRGAERRRLLDLGFVPGTTVEVEMMSPSGDPTAYRVRGTLIALRREQAALVRVTKPEAT